MEKKVLERLEEMAKNPEGILSICGIEDCGKMKITLNSEVHWIGREDLHPKMYDSIVESYKQLGIDKNFSEGLSHTYCPKDLEAYLGSIGR